MMKTFFDWLAEKNPNEKIPEKEIPGSWFSERGLPMIVHCTNCGMTMALPSAMIDEDGYIYCEQCGDC